MNVNENLIYAFLQSETTIGGTVVCSIAAIKEHCGFTTEEVGKALHALLNSRLIKESGMGDGDARYFHVI